jgi:hippurate hydrolase
VALAHGVRVELDYQPGYPPTVNAAAPSALCRQAGQATVGADRLFTDLKPSMGAEDFAYLSAVVPGCYAWIGNGPADGGCLLHSPNYDFNDAIIPDGVRYWLKLVELALPPQAT